MLNERKKKILQIIIEDYISTAEPVGSRTIARKHDLGLSPATIRNEMSDLELLGYLEQPHTSAGRVPSAQAYRFYVDSMIEPDTLDDNDRTLINTLYRERQRSIDDIFLSTAKILSQMTHNVSMVLANQHTISRFCYLKFLPLDTNHAILCIVTDDGNVNNCVVEIPAGMSAKELELYRREKLGFVFQSYNLTPDLTVRENIEMTAELVQEPLRADTLIEELGLKKYETYFPKELSGGQQQRVAIARAMVKKPDILLCDELTGALDTKSSKDVLQRVQKMNDTYKTTVVIITHNLNIAGMADRIIKITDGKVVSNQKNVDKKRVEEMEL